MAGEHPSQLFRRAFCVIGRWSLILPALLLAGCLEESPSALHSQLFDGVEVIGSRGSALGQFNKPRSVAVDRQDNLYVVDMTGRVQKFSPRGEFIKSWQLPQTDLGKPKGMCLDPKGNIVVVEPHYQRVNHFSTEGDLVQQWGRKGTNLGELILPRSIAINSRGETFLSEYTTVDRVQGFTADAHRAFLCFGQPGDANGEFNRAEGLGVDAQDRLFVADSCNHRVQVFGRDGKWLATFGRAGRGAGEMSYPYDVRVDAAGLRFVCEFGNSRIQVFDSNNQPVEIIGGPGAEPGQFNNPWSIALDSHGNLYVADALNHRVQKLVRRKSVVSGPWSVASSQAHNSSRRDATKIARRFNAGNVAQRSMSPEGTAAARAFLEPSLRDWSTQHNGPGVETPGYSQMSLWDKPSGMPGKTSAHLEGIAVKSY